MWYWSSLSQSEGWKVRWLQNENVDRLQYLSRFVSWWGISQQDEIITTNGYIPFIHDSQYENVDYSNEQCDNETIDNSKSIMIKATGQISLLLPWQQQYCWHEHPSPLIVLAVCRLVALALFYFEIVSGGGYDDGQGRRPTDGEKRKQKYGKDGLGVDRG